MQGYSVPHSALQLQEIISCTQGQYVSFIYSFYFRALCQLERWEGVRLEVVDLFCWLLDVKFYVLDGPPLIYEQASPFLTHDNVQVYVHTHLRTSLIGILRFRIQS